MGYYEFLLRKKFYMDGETYKVKEKLKLIDGWISRVTCYNIFIWYRTTNVIKSYNSLIWLFYFPEAFV